MLAPKKQKYRRTFRGKNKGSSFRGTKIEFGEYGLKALTRALISAVQIEAARRAISHFTKREGKVWVRIFPDKPITAKAAGAGMGAGKGEVKGYVAVVAPGKIIFELSGVSDEAAAAALKRAGDKLPVKTKFLKRQLG